MIRALTEYQGPQDGACGAAALAAMLGGSRAHWAARLSAFTDGRIRLAYTCCQVARVAGVYPAHTAADEWTSARKAPTLLRWAQRRENWAPAIVLITNHFVAVEAGLVVCVGRTSWSRARSRSTAGAATACAR